MASANEFAISAVFAVSATVVIFYAADMDLVVSYDVSKKYPCSIHVAEFGYMDTTNTLHGRMLDASNLVLQFHKQESTRECLIQ